MATQVNDNPHTMAMARFTAALRYEDIPVEVIRRIKLLILDALGCGLYGADLEWSRILQRTIGQIDHTAHCTIWGTAAKTSAPHAALINGTQVQGFELDDVHRLGMLHTGAVVLPALLAIAEGDPHLSGKEFLAAAVAGYEIGPRVGMCMGSAHVAQGWHSGATVGVFAAAAASARALQLSSEQTVDALGIAGTQASGLLAAQYGSMVKRMHAGRASQSGFYGALLAKDGFTGIRNVFESRYGGYCTTFSRSPDRFDLGALAAGLGTVWQTLNMRIKFYACVRSNHGTLDAIRRLHDLYQFDVDEIAEIMVYASEVTTHHSGWTYAPRGVTSAQMNLSFCVATLLLEGACFVAQFTDESVADPARMRLAAKIRVIHDPQITARGAKFRHMVRIAIKLNDGRTLNATAEDEGNDESAFGTPDDVQRKFATLAGKTLHASQIQRLRDAILDLESISSAQSIATLLAVAPA